jgi:hypothetical protein
MEKAGEKLIDEEEIVGMVQITVYNDCFAIEYTAGLSMDDITGLFVAALEKIGGETEERVVH